MHTHPIAPPLWLSAEGGSETNFSSFASCGAEIGGSQRGVTAEQVLRDRLSLEGVKYNELHLSVS